MEHADIIISLCRTSLTGGSPAVRHQIERLRDALGAEDPTATVLSRMLSQAGRSLEMRPSRMTRAAERLRGETLTASTIVPVDRETSNPLVDVIPVQQLPQIGPILPAAMATSIDALLEEWSNIDRLRDGGVEPAMSALIYGQPGTGKTQLALWIGRQLQLPVVAARLDGLISSFLGTTSRNIGALFAFAERYRCLLLLDEFDAVAKMRDDPQEVGEIKRVVNTLLQSLDARKTVGPTIAVTNHEMLLDPAIWRRFDLQIGMPLPTREARIEMIRRYAPPLELTDTQVAFLSWCLSDVSGSEIETFLRSLKRSYLINDDRSSFSLLAAVRSYVSLNANRLAAQKSSALARDDEALALALKRDGDTSPVDLGKLFGVHRATINRWLKSGDAELVRA